MVTRQKRGENPGMVYRRNQRFNSARSGYYRFENVRGEGKLFGFGTGEFVRLRDEYGVEWNGTAEPQGDNITRYRFCSQHGKIISGVSDGSAIMLRDERGNAWRGFID
jgi:hypothetical protein